MHFLLFKYSECKIEKGHDKLLFYRQYIFSSETFERQSSVNLDILHWPIKKGAWNKRCLTKKRLGPTPSNIFAFFSNSATYKKNGPQQNHVFFIVREPMPLSIMEVPFFSRLVSKQNPCINFPLRHHLSCKKDQGKVCISNYWFM
jgi:hypothetical protein